LFDELRELKERVEWLTAQLNRLVAIGKVVAVDEKTAKVRVELGEKDKVVTYWLPVLTQKTELDKEYWMPDVDELVVCIFTPPSFERGFVVGSYYTAEDPPPVTDRNKYHRRFKDGTVIEYDRKNHRLYIHVEGEIFIHSTGHTTIKADGKVDIDGGSGDLSGVVTHNCICPFTGRPHSDYSANVKASRG
jgi:phage baseplate assembly protein V